MSAPIGIMGGTFDPVHFGHLRLAQEAAEILGLERVRWVPAGRPWHRGAPRAPATHRLEMVRLAIEKNDLFELDDAEIRQTALPAPFGRPRLHRGARTLRPAGRRSLMVDLRKLQKAALAALGDIKAREIEVFDVTHLTSMFDRVIIASADSARQLKALASHVREEAKAAGGRVHGVEGEDGGDWVLVDLGDIVVHIMQPAVRSHYNLEELWGQPRPRRPRARRPAAARAK